MVQSKLFTVLIALFFVGYSTNATVYTVSDKATLQTRMSSTLPGDTVIVANGTYNWGQIIFSNANGTPSSAWIVLKAQTNFGVVFTGNTYLQFSGKRILITGFKFASGNSSANDVIQFKTSSTVFASYCRLNNVIIDNYNSDSTGTATATDVENKWVSIYGVRNRVDHCTFINKSNNGATLVVWYDNSNYPQQSTSTYHLIDSNYFKERSFLGGNGGESMRIGVGLTSSTYGYNIIEYNLFENLIQTEPEIISNKSGFNTYRYNTIKNSKGGITLRRGRYCSVYGNFIINSNAALTDDYGIRIIDKGHKVFNNYIEGVNGNKNSLTSMRCPIILYNGFYSVNDTTDPSHVGSYMPGDSSIIAFNTIVNCEGGAGIVLGFTDAGANTYQPLGLKVSNNVIKMTTGQIAYIDPVNTQLTYLSEGNVYNAPNGLGLSSSTGFTNTTLTFGSRSNRILPPPSLVQDAAVNTGSYSSLLTALDAQGQTRSAVYDIGCDEINGSGAVLYYPLDSNLVGAGKPVALSQTITFPAIATKIFGNADFNPGATASSGLTVSYTSSNTSVATIVGGNIHIVGVGTSTITASQGGDQTYAAASDVTQTLTVSKASQTITFSALPVKYIGDADFNPGATASSGLAVSYASSNTAVATIVAGNIHVAGIGTATITASQNGDGNYNAATDAIQVLTVNKLVQTITFPAIPTKVVGNADFNPGATSSAGLTISYSSSNTTVATIVGGNIHIVGAGTSVITASQAGNGTYAAATNVNQTLAVTSTTIFATGDYRSAVATGNWSNVNSWQIRDASGNWTTPSIVPSNTNNVFIQNGHTVTADITASCKDLHLHTSARLVIGANIVQVKGKMRAFTGTTITGVSDDVFYSSQASASSGFSSTMATTTTGTIRIVGASRTVFANGEWGASAFSGCAIEFNMDNGATALLDASIKFKSITLANGTTLNAAGNRIGADDGLSPNGGSVTIKTGGKIISSRSGITSQVISALSTSKCGTVTIESGATLELTGSIPVIDAGAFVNNGTVIYSMAGAQTLLQKGADATSVNPANYYDIRLQGSGVKQLPAFNIAIANALYAESSASLSNTTNTASKAIMANGSTIYKNSTTTVALVPTTIAFGSSATDVVNVTINASGTNGGELFSPSPGILGTLTIAGGVDYNITNSVTINNLNNNGKITVTPASTLTMTITGLLSGTGLVKSGSAGASLAFSGAGNAGTIYFDQTTPGTTNSFSDFTINRTSSGSVTLANAATFSGNFSLANGTVSFAPSSAQTLTLNGAMSRIAGHLSSGNSNASLAINGVGDAGTLFFDQSIPGTTNVFKDFTLNRTSSGKVTLGNNVTFNGVTTLSNGSLQIGNNQTLTINGNFLNNTGSGTISGGADQTTTNLPNLIVSGTGITNTLKFTSGFTEFGDVTFSRSAAIDATMGNGLRVNGTVQISGASTTLATQDNLIIRSTGNATGRVGNLTGITNPVSGKVTVERYMPSMPTRRWRFLSIPTNTSQSINASWQNSQVPGVVGSTNVGTCITSSLPNALALGYDAVTNGNSLLSHNVSTGFWEGVTSNTTSTGVSTDRGYMIFLRGDRNATPANNITDYTILSTKGMLKTGNYPVTPLSISANKHAALGNPYASAIDLRNLILGGNADRVFYLWDPKISGTYGLGAFQTLTWIGSNYIITPGGGSYGASGSVMNTVQSGQAFLAHATGGAGSIQFNENCKVAGSTNVSRKTSLSAYIMTNLMATDPLGDKLADGTMILFDSSFSNVVNGSDALKVKNFGENFGMAKAGQTLVVEQRKPINIGDTVFYKMENLKPNHSYKLVFGTSELNCPGLVGRLQDTFTNTSVLIDLNGKTEYQFNITADSASSGSDRFKLVFTQGQVLSVNFKSIKAWQHTTDNIMVEWQVAKEQNIHHYEIEKSADGRSFEMIEVQAPIGGNASSTIYNWVDKNGIKGVNYYRIKSIGQSGEIIISPIVKVKIKSEASGITVFPNPVKDRKLCLKFEDMPKGVYYIRLINQMGQVLMTSQLVHEGGSATKQILLQEHLPKSNLQVEITNQVNGSNFLLQIIN